MRQSFIKFIFILAAVLSSLFGNAELLRPDSCLLKRLKPARETSLFLVSAGYKLPVNKATIINSGHGFYLEAGVNIARLFSTKTIIGVYGGWSMMDRLWSTSFNSNFINDFQNAYNPDAGLNPLDSSVASSFAGIMTRFNGKSVTAPGCEMKSFHNYSLYYGISLKLPYRYCPVLKLYTGFTRSHLQGPSGLITSKKDYNSLQLRRSMYGAELVIFRGIQSAACDGGKPCQLNNGALSIYYECNNLSNSSIHFDDGDKQTTVAIKKITSPAFLARYHRECYWGVKLSFLIL